MSLRRGFSDTYRSGASRGANLRRRGVLTAAMLLGFVLAAEGQRPSEELDFRARPEAWAMRYFSTITLFTGFGPADYMEPWSASASLEVSHIPRLSEEERRVGFNGNKVEDMNKAPFLIRPAALLGLPAGFSLSLSYVPPVRAFDVKTALYAAALSRPLIETGPFRSGVRVFAQSGKIRGGFTCPEDEWMDPLYAAWGCDEPSNDAMRTEIYGAEISASYRIDALGGLTPYAGISIHYMDLEFEVDAMTHGVRDNRKLFTNGTSWAASVGADYPIGRDWTLSAGVRYAPLTIERPERERRRESLLHAQVQLLYAFP